MEPPAALADATTLPDEAVSAVDASADPAGEAAPASAPVASSPAATSAKAAAGAEAGEIEPAPEEGDPPSPVAGATPPKADFDRYHAVLWSRFDEALRRSKAGLDSLAVLSKFVSKRKAAERELAKVCQGMTQAGGSLAKLGGWQRDLIDTLHETGRVNEAWAMLMEKTMATAVAHDEVASHLENGVESRLRAFGTSKLQLYQSLQERGQAQQKTLVEARAAKVKARATYCKANTEYAHCQLLKRPAQKQTEANTKMMDSRSLYSASIDHLNKVEVRAAKGLRRILEELHRMELERLALTREMMVAYMEITSETLPMAIGEPVVSELRPAVQSIDATQNMRDFVERCERRAPVIEPGTQQLVEYRPLEDCPDDKRSAASLEELGGGPVKKGSLGREEGLRKRFERRWCVAWPADWKELRRPGPLLFVYEDEHGARPAKVVDLSTVRMSDLVHPREKHPHAFRIASSGKDGGELVLSADTAAEVQSWKAFFAACAKGEAKRSIQWFGAALPTMVEQQRLMLEQESSAESSQDPGVIRARSMALTCRAPFLFIDVLEQLRKLGAARTEGIFRIPGDAVEVLALRTNYESGAEYSVALESSSALDDVAVWASFVKSWLRELEMALIPVAGGFYERAVALAAEHMGTGRARSASNAELDADADGRLEAVAKAVTALIQELDPAHQRVIYHLVEFLREIDAGATRMTVQNLAICLAPCFFRCEDMGAALANAQKEILITKVMIMELPLPTEELAAEREAFRGCFARGAGNVAAATVATAAAGEQAAPLTDAVEAPL